MNSRLITIIDDEEDIIQLVSLNLTKAGYFVKGFFDAESFFDFLSENVPELAILDLMLPDADGFEICKKMKRDSRLSSVPIIMLTAKDEETDKVLGLELGADDYITKPFSPRELVARVKAVLRRQTPDDDSKKVKIGNDIIIDTEKYEVTAKNKKLDLTTTEFKILQLLSSRKGWVFTRNQILEYLWGNEKYVIDRTIDVHVRNLREKLGVESDYIKSVRGIGYKLED